MPFSPYYCHNFFYFKIYFCRYSLASREVCTASKCEYSVTCVKRHESRVPLEKIISPPFQMGLRRSPRGHAADSEQSSPTTLLLAPGIVQAAKALIAQDKHRYRSDVAFQ